jgi:cobalt/nickel transport system permease protein
LQKLQYRGGAIACGVAIHITIGAHFIPRLDLRGLVRAGDLRMHIPDGFLDLRTAATTGALSLSGIAIALGRLRRGLPRRRIPLMGLAAAFLFAAQMLNFPVAAGTSGHLLGAVLAAVLVGPSAAVVVMTAVLLVQALLFADGGVLALGANVFNMAIVAVLGGFFVFRPLQRLLPGPRGLLMATAFASWWSVLLASIACAAELAGARVAPWGLVFPAMAGIHMLIGLGEALIAALVVAAILRTRPDLLDFALRTRAAPHAGAASRLRLPTAYGLAAILGLVVFGVPLASTRPDGLERVAALLGFRARALTAPLPTPLADYQLPGLGSASAATWAAGCVGVLVVFALAHGLALALVPRPNEALVSEPKHETARSDATMGNTLPGAGA